MHIETIKTIPTAKSADQIQRTLSSPTLDKSVWADLSYIFDIKRRTQLIILSETDQSSLNKTIEHLNLDADDFQKINGLIYHTKPTHYVFRYYFLILILMFIASHVCRKIKETKKIKEMNSLIEQLNSNKINDECVNDLIENMQISPGIKETIQTAKRKKKQFLDELNDHAKNLCITEAKVEFLSMCLNNQYKEVKMHEYRFQELMHEVTTPLSASIKQLEAMKGSVDHKTYAKIKEIYDNSSFALAATQMALRKHLLGDKASTLSSINMRELVEQSFKMASNGKLKELSQIDFNINIESDSKQTPINPISDKNLIQSILINLFNNAIKYSNKSRLTVDIKHRAEKNAANNMLTTISIEDEGPGFSDAFLNSLEVNENRRIGEPSFGIGLQLVNEYLAKLNSTLVLENTRDENKNIIGAKCTFTINTQYSIPEGEKFSKYCNVAIYSDNKKLKENLKTIFEEKSINVNFVSDDELSINSNNTVLIIDFEFNKFTTRDIRLAASQHNEITTIVVCRDDEYKSILESDMLLPFECEEDGVLYDNIYAIPKPVTSDEIFSIINKTKQLDTTGLSKQNLDALIIEDNTLEADNLISLLGRCFNVKVARNFTEAGRCLKHFNFDLIVSDVNFSDGTTINKLKDELIKSNGYKIAHTGLSPDSERVTVIKELFDCITAKSANYNELTKLIENHFKLKMPAQTIPQCKVIEKQKLEFYELKEKIESEGMKSDFPRYVASIHRVINTLNKLGVVNDDEEQLMRLEHKLHLSRIVTDKDHEKTCELLRKTAKAVGKI
ncbi:ATP-binding protein [Pseudoalteromonas marina]|uniref:ATP-binding protein n=1 Tax=Pseudoalteromonas marina TaxID=267375 RepID=A0ABT9FG79_9GAMM|nr:ATP-binding protein [Pseudoalteromonas marina]MDP2565795.1 ATP-binding protein [Pseudoalteromonas marina]